MAANITPRRPNSARRAPRGWNARIGFGPGRGSLIAASLASLSSLVLLAVAPSASAAQAPRARFRVSHDVRHDVSPPLRSLKGFPPPRGLRFDDLKQLPHANRAEPQRLDPVMQRSSTGPVAATVVQNFEGLGNGQYGFTVTFMPPDTNGSVSGTQYVQWVNTSFIVFNKLGNVLLGPVAGNAIWAGFGGPCQTDNDGDVLVRFDQLAGRWVFSQLAVPAGGPPSYQCVAVSTSSDSTGSYYRYAFEYPSTEIDYPKLAIWPDAYYASSNQFDASDNYLGPEACAFDRTKMLAGNPASQVCFQENTSVGFFLPSDLDGATLPPTGSPAYYVNYDPSSLDALDLWQFHVDFTTPVNSTFTETAVLAVAPFTPACATDPCIPQLGTSQLLDSLSDRVMYRLAYRHFPSGAESLVLNHSVGNPSGIRWYEIRDPGGTPQIYQQGTYSPDATPRWMGSIAQDQSADIAVGYSVSGPVFPGLRFTGRLGSDPLGTMEDEAALVDGGGSQQGSQPPADHRWGDYSAMTIDPTDDCTFWYTSEYIPVNGDFNWHTRISAIRFTGCGQTPVANVSPSSLAFSPVEVGSSSPPQNITVTNTGPAALAISGVSIQGSGFTEASSCPASLATNSSCTISVNFAPVTAGAQTAVLVISDNAPGEPQDVTLSGTGTAPVANVSPSSLTFASQVVGTTSAPQTVTLSNTGTATLIIEGVGITGDFSQTNNCGGSVAAGANCTFNVSFTPTATGTRTGTLTITDNNNAIGNSTQSVSLAGTGVVGAICLAPPSVSFANQPIDTPSPAQLLTVTSCGSAAVTITSITASSGFAQTNTCPSTLNPGASCSVNAVFHPVTRGAQSGAITITDNVGMQPCPLSGTATPNSTRTVDFDGDGKADYAVWRPSTATWWVNPSGSPSMHLSQLQGEPGDIPVSGDYDGDGLADYAVWRPSNGTWYVIPSGHPGSPIATVWGKPGDVPVPADYDGDGKIDYAVWRPSNFTWYIVPSSNPSAPITQVWGEPGDIPVPGDYDGDGKADYAVWRPSTGTWWVLPSGSPGTKLTTVFGLVGDIPVQGDYDGDGKADYAVWRPSTGTWYVLPSGGGPMLTQAWGVPGDIPVVGDFDGDHKNDYALWRPSTGQWFVINSSSGKTTTGGPWGVSGDLPAQHLPVQETRDKHTANFDGDRKTDIAVWRPSTAAWWVIPSSNPSTPTSHVWGLAGDIPVPGDYDGDGKTDDAVWRPSTGTWYVSPSSAPGTTYQQVWGVPGDIPVPGDYDGDGKTDFAVWRPSTGTWYVIPSSAPGTTYKQAWGISGDIPVPGDYDGDGKTDYAVWRPSNATWYIIPSSAPTTRIQYVLGGSSDIPVPGDYDGDGKTDYAVWAPSSGTWSVVQSSNPAAPITKVWGQNGDVPVPKDYDGDEKTDFAVWRPSSGTWYIIPSSTPSKTTATVWGVSSDVPLNKPTGQ